MKNSKNVDRAKIDEKDQAQESIQESFVAMSRNLESCV